MDIKIFIFIICGSVFLSCNKHTCSCKEVAGKAILDEYEKTIHNSLSCEDLNTTKYRGGDTIEVVWAMQILCNSLFYYFLFSAIIPTQSFTSFDILIAQKLGPHIVQ